MFPDLTTRLREEEWMDRDAVPAAQLRRSLRFIRRVNRFLGYTRATLHHLKRFARTWRPGRPITILDVATGSADIPLAILRWSRRRGFDVRIVGLDRHDLTARMARRHAAGALPIIRGDALALPFADGAFDYALTSMFLHHLDEPQIVQVLREMDRVSRRGIIAADLLRDRRAYLWVSLFTALSNPIIRHDARVSVAQALTPSEVLSLRNRAGIDYADYHDHFAHRFVLAGEKLSPRSPASPE